MLIDVDNLGKIPSQDLRPSLEGGLYFPHLYA
jgi:hypothetical protein